MALLVWLGVCDLRWFSRIAGTHLLDLQLDPKPDSYNVSFNSGNASGQTVPHVHIHVIPRYLGGMPDPRGGVRQVIPEKGNTCGQPCLPALQSSPFQRFSFFQVSSLTPAISHPTALLRKSIGQRFPAADIGENSSFKVRLAEISKLSSKPDSFHPKAWRIIDTSGGLLVVGSGNLSKAEATVRTAIRSQWVEW